MGCLRCSALLHVVFSAFLGGGAVTAASAQPVSGAATDFSGLGNARTIVVVDDTGRETTGRLVRVAPDSLAMKVDGRERVFERQDVTTVYRIGDPLKNGMLIGLAVGGGLGFLAGALETECGGFFGESRECSVDEKFRLGAVGGGLFGLVGLGVGAAVDRAISRRTVLYTRSPRAGTMAISVTPWLADTRASLRITAAW